MNRIRVVSPGLLTTVQDLGRPGYAHLGISASGAADALSLRAGNLLVGNAGGAAALEMTLAGGAFEFESDAVIAITGADFDCSVPQWRAVPVRAGELVRCGHARSGARCYLAVAGGIDVPLLFGSASTHLLTGIGGWQGRALKRGDLLHSAHAHGVPRWSARPAPPIHETLLRVTALHDAAALCGQTWQVREDSDRMGLRLRGTALAGRSGRILTEGVPLGAVQLPPDGQPIILFVEHQTTGGYGKIANVISADFHRAGQLRPGEPVRFAQVSIEAAIELLRAQESWLDALD